MKGEVWSFTVRDPTEHGHQCAMRGAARSFVTTLELFIVTSPRIEVINRVV